MSINWPKFSTEPNPNTESKAHGALIKKLVDAALPKAAANYRALQLAKAEEARRQRQETIDSARAAAIYGSDVLNDFPPQRKEEPKE